MSGLLQGRLQGGKRKTYLTDLDPTSNSEGSRHDTLCRARPAYCGESYASKGLSFLSGRSKECPVQAGLQAGTQADHCSRKAALDMWEEAVWLCAAQEVPSALGPFWNWLVTVREGVKSTASHLEILHITEPLNYSCYKLLLIK